MRGWNINDINREPKCVKGKRNETVREKHKIEVTLVHDVGTPVSSEHTWISHF